MKGRENRQKRQTDKQTDRGELCGEERIGRINRQTDKQTEESYAGKRE